MKTAAEVGDIWLAGRKDLENWPSRFADVLRTKFQPSVHGVPRLYSRENVLEISVMSALVRGGAHPRTAAMMAARINDEIHRKAQREWLVFPAGNAKSFIWSDAPNLATLQKEFGPTKTLSLVPIGEIVRRVNKLFEGD